MKTKKIDISRLEELLMANEHFDIINIMLDNVRGYTVKFGGVGDSEWTIVYPLDLKYEEVLPFIAVHSDTVSNKKPTDLITVNDIMRNPDGVLGADDRAGCYIASEMMRNNIRAIYGIFSGEECGGVGVSNFTTTATFDNILKNVSAFIELDRRGGYDCATYGYDNMHLINLFDMLWYKEAFGSYTDAVTLSDNSGIACINISVGYENEHTRKEELNLKHLLRTTNVMLNMLPQDLYHTVFEAEKRVIDCGNTEDEAVTCEICGEHGVYWRLGELEVCDECYLSIKGDTWYE